MPVDSYLDLLASGWKSDMDRRDGSSVYGFEWGGQQLLDAVRDKCGHLMLGKSVCEIGCGGGKWTKWLYDACGASRVIAVDVHESAVAATAKHEPRAEVILLAGDELPGMEVDVVFSYDVFLHLPRDLVVRYMQQSAAIAKQMVFALPDIGTKCAREQMLRQVEKTPWKNCSHTSINFYSREEVESLAEMTGWVFSDLGVIPCDCPRDRMYVLWRQP